MRVTVATFRTRVPDRGRRVCNVGENLGLVSYFGPSGPSCLSAEGFGPPPVSSIFSKSIRVASAAIGNRQQSRARRTIRSTGNPVGRWRR
jgi:hypothetical protein